MNDLSFIPIFLEINWNEKTCRLNGDNKLGFKLKEANHWAENIGVNHLIKDIKMLCTKNEITKILKEYPEFLEYFI